MADTHGQLDGRAERIRKTSNWLGATPYNDFGELITEEDADFEVNLEMVNQTVHQIRCGLASGHGCVRVAERHRPTCQAIAAQLSREDLSRVVFDLENVMPPESDELPAETTTEPRGSVRDIIRTKRPNVLTTEDGTLRPSP